MTAAVLSGLGGQLPARAITNHDLAGQLDTSDEWIRTRTGITQRYVIEPGEATSDLAVGAGRAALASAETETVDVVVLATATPDHPCPATAPLVASRLGLRGVAAFDIGAVCAGFVYALSAAAGLIANGMARSALVIGADTFSTISNPLDRSTRAIFGDGAGAVVMRAGDRDEPGALLAFDLGSDGSDAGLITVAAGGSRQRSSGRPGPADEQYFSMQGRSVFMNAVLKMAGSTRAVLAATGWAASDICHLVAHQANARILAALAEELDLPSDRVVSNIAQVGNTVAASIPLALADAAAAGTLQTEDRVVLTAFGGGLTWGAVALRWPNLPNAALPRPRDPVQQMTVPT